MLPENKSINNAGFQMEKAKVIDELPHDYRGYCPSLWKEIFVNTRGNVGPCCVWQDKEWAGQEWAGEETEIKTVGSDLHNTEYLQKQRQTVLDNKIPKGCNYCVKQEEIGIKSQRKHLIDKLGPLDENIFKSTRVTDDAIEYLDIRPGNTCNYMCNFCSPFASHLIGKEWKKSDEAGDSQFFVQYSKELKFSSSQVKMEFVDSFSKFKNLKFVHVAGGEPLYMRKELSQIIDSIPNKHQVTFRVITNLSLYNEEIMEKLSEFKKVRFQLSVDGVGKSIEISRWRSNWENIQSNIKKYIEYRNNHPQFDMAFVPAISVYTLLTLPELLQFAMDNKIYSDVLFVQDPKQQRINLLPVHVLENIKEKIIQKFLGNEINSEYCNYRDIIQQLNYYIENNKITSETIDMFWDWQQYFEKQRNYSLKEELPDVYNVIKKQSR